MDAFYEESAVNNNAKNGEKRYKITNVASIIALSIGLILAIICIFNIPISSNATTEEEIQAYEFVKFLCIFSGMQAVFFLGLWFLLFKLKARFNVSYDYIFVSGELRIAKVFNVNRRKIIARIDSENILQIGDIDNSSYERLRSDPSTKEVICTANNETSDDKFFMYILANVDGKKLYVLECREALLMNILKFTRRGTLESDYVMQEKKQKTV